MPCPVGVKNHDLYVRVVEGGVVVSSVPDDNIGLLFCLLKNLPIVDPGINNNILSHQGFVLFPLLNRAVVLFKILIAGKTLYHLRFQIPIGHGVANGDNPFPLLFHDPTHVASGLGFAASRSHRTNRHDRFLRSEHRIGGTDKDEIRPSCHGHRGLVHDVYVGNIAVGKGD